MNMSPYLLYICVLLYIYAWDAGMVEGQWMARLRWKSWKWKRSHPKKDSLASAVLFHLFWDPRKFVPRYWARAQKKKSPLKAQAPRRLFFFLRASILSLLLFFSFLFPLLSPPPPLPSLFPSPPLFFCVCEFYVHIHTYIKKRNWNSSSWGGEETLQIFFANTRRGDIVVNWLHSSPASVYIKIYIYVYIYIYIYIYIYTNIQAAVDQKPRMYWREGSYVFKNWTDK